MSKPCDPKIQELVARWSEIRGTPGAVDYQLARWASAVVAAFPDRKHFNRFHVDFLDVRTSSTIKMHWSMAAAVAAVPDEATWKAVKWDGVRRLVRKSEQAENAAAKPATKPEPASHSREVLLGLIQRDLKTVREALRRLIGGGYGFLRDLLTVEELEAAALLTPDEAKALKAKAKKTRAS